MNNLLFFRRCFAFRHAARVELQKARMLPPGPERNQARKLARALRDLARNEAWLEGQTLRTHRNEARFVIGEAAPEQIGRAHDRGGELDQIVVANCAAPVRQNFVMPTEGHCSGDDFSAVVDNRRLTLSQRHKKRPRRGRSAPGLEV